MRIAFYGSSLLSSYWNGAATYYRGILAPLAARGYDDHVLRAGRVRSAGASRHRAAGLGPVVVYPATDATGCARCWRRPPAADVVVKASGVGVFDDELLAGMLDARRAGRAAAVLGCRCAGDARRACAASPRIRCARALPRSTWC